MKGLKTFTNLLPFVGPVVGPVVGPAHELDLHFPDLHFPDLQFPDLHFPDLQLDLQLHYLKRTYIWLILLLLISCSEEKAPPLFNLKSPQETGIDFINRVTENDSLNIIQYLYYYNGGGVAVGDINNDGLPDIYFSSNLESNKLYLNKGNLTFEDITEAAEVAGKGTWSTGVSMVDINADGWLDIYVCQVGNYKSFKGKNQLFINQGNQTGSPRFVEQAADYGLDHEGFSTQAAYLDYDGDGDLDMFLLCHSVHSTESYRDTSKTRKRDFRAGDKLYRNDLNEAKGPPFFTEVSEEAGILGGIAGYGLGVAVGDIDKNGCPDIFVGNDFHENDFLYLNDCQGKFIEASATSLGHTSNFSMGNDLSDLNNDGWLDLLTMDMKPDDEEVFKSSAGIDPYDIYLFKRSYGYAHQLPRNMLQLNQAKTGQAKFSETGQMVGIAATDWSWSALVADFDNDGKKDIHISNGIIRRPNNLDYLKFIANQQIQAHASDLELAAQMPDGKISNVLYQQDESGHFTNKSTIWDLNRPSFSQGAAYADLDRDGDLDLVVNNSNDPAFLYENLAAQITEQNFLQINLEGPKNNPFGIGSQVHLYGATPANASQSTPQFQELYLTRGWQSSVEAILHFGLGKMAHVDSIQIRWPDGKTNTLTGPQINQRIDIGYDDARVPTAPQPVKEKEPLFSKISPPSLPLFQHKENLFLDNQRESLIPYLLSTQGPRIAVADVNGDGKEDFFIGGATQQAGALFVQTSSGNFQESQQELFEQDAVSEDVALLFFDADQDGDADLYVSSAGNQFYRENPALQDRLYFNDGLGNFSKSTDALPLFYGQGSCVKAADFDKDGDLDLFVGNRSVPVSYGISPDSYVLVNDGFGKFSLSEIGTADMSGLGMVTDAAWTDSDQDGDMDLVLIGDWMSPTLFRNENGKLEKENPAFTDEKGKNLTPSGWWNRIEIADLDSDGDPDWVLGNFGMNSNLQPSPEAPVQLYIRDFDANLSKDPIMTYYRQGKEYPVGGLDELSMQLVMLKKRFQRYDQFANSSIKEIFTEQELEASLKKKVEYFYSAIAWNEGKGNFRLEKLPDEVQASSIQSIMIEDFMGDEKPEILMAGNFFDIQPAIGLLDANHGVLLKQNDQGKYVVIKNKDTGLWLEGQVRDMQKIHVGDQKVLLVARNNASMESYLINLEK